MVHQHGMTFPSITLIGFGEAAKTFADAARWETSAIAFDTDPAKAVAIDQSAVMRAPDSQSALSNASVVLSLVTADQALDAATLGAPFLKPSALWLDMNSVAPHTKQAAALAIDAVGGRYVDVAVLAPVNPAQLSVPLLLSGPHADTALGALMSFGFTNVRIVSTEVGYASAIKMIRSIMVKGIEALTAEMMAAAAAAGVTDEVLRSLDASERGASWRERADYNLERMTSHGARRAAEMEQVAATLRTLNIDPIMTDSTRCRQSMAASQAHLRRGVRP